MEHGGHARAVFVDPTGRRHRRVVRSAWGLAGLGAASVAVVVVSLLLPPSVSRLSVPGLGPVLPGPAAAPLGKAEGEAAGPDVLLARSPSPAPPAVTPRPARSVRTTGSPMPGSTSTRMPTTGPATTAPTQAPTTAGPTVAATGRPTSPASEPPGQSQPPGQASRSPKPRPTPSRGPR